MEKPYEPLYFIGETLIDYDGTQIVIIDKEDGNYMYKESGTQEIKHAPFKEIDRYFCIAISYREMLPLIEKLKSMEDGFRNNENSNKSSMTVEKAVNILKKIMFNR